MNSPRSLDGIAQPHPEARSPIQQLRRAALPLLTTLAALVPLRAQSQVDQFTDPRNEIGNLLQSTCLASNGKAMELHLNSLPSVGNPNFKAVATNLPDNVPVAAIISFGAVPGVQFGCTTLFDPALPTWQYMTRDTFDPSIAYYQMAIASPGLVGLEVSMQAVAFDPAGIALSAGRRFRVTEASDPHGAIVVLDRQTSGLVGVATLIDGRRVDAAGLPSAMLIEPLEVVGQHADLRLDDAGSNNGDIVIDNALATYVDVPTAGRLYAYSSPVESTAGMFLVTDGLATVRPLFESPAYPAVSLGTHVAISADHDLVAVRVNHASGADSVAVAQTRTVDEGSRSWQVAPAMDVEIVDSSIHFVGDHIAFLGLDTSTGNESLFFAPSNGSAFAQPIAFPSLGSGPRTIDPTLLVADEISVACAVRQGGSQQVFRANANGLATNLTGFASSVVIEDFASTADITDDGLHIAFAASSGPRSDLYVLPTDGSAAGSAQQNVWTISADFPSNWGHILGVDMLAEAANGVTYWYGPDAAHLECFQTYMGETSLFHKNVSKTSTEAEAPFAAAGTLQPRLLSDNDHGYTLLEITQDGGQTWDLAAFSIGSVELHSITGSVFGPTGIPSYTELTEIEVAPVIEFWSKVSDRIAFVTKGTAGSSVIGVDTRTLSQPAVLGSAPPGIEVNDVSFDTLASSTAWVQSSLSSSAVHNYDWAAASSNLVHSISEQLADGTLTFVDHGDQTIAAAVGSGNIAQPTQPSVLHTSVRTGQSTDMAALAGDVTAVAGVAPAHLVHQPEAAIATDGAEGSFQEQAYETLFASTYDPESAFLTLSTPVAGPGVYVGENQLGEGYTLKVFSASDVVPEILGSDAIEQQIKDLVVSNQVEVYAVETDIITPLGSVSAVGVIMSLINENGSFVTEFVPTDSTSNYRDIGPHYQEFLENFSCPPVVVRRWFRAGPCIIMTPACMACLDAYNDKLDEIDQELQDKLDDIEEARKDKHEELEDAYDEAIEDAKKARYRCLRNTAIAFATCRLACLAGGPFAPWCILLCSAGSGAAVAYCASDYKADVKKAGDRLREKKDKANKKADEDAQKALDRAERDRQKAKDKLEKCLKANNCIAYCLFWAKLTKEWGLEQDNYYLESTFIRILQ